MTKPIILTGDRPTGKLHLGHYVGSLKNRLITRLMNLAVRYYIFYKPASWLFNGIISNYILPKLRLKLKDGK